MKLTQSIAGVALLCASVLGNSFPAQFQQPLFSVEDGYTRLPKAQALELLFLHRSLCEIESISGNEEKVGRFLKSYLESHNFTVELQEVEKNRYNVLAWPGEQRFTKVLVTSHIDTV